MVITHTATGFQQYFHLGTIKNIDLETVSYLTSPTKKNPQKVSKMTPKRVPKWTLKSIKLDTWTSRCLVGVPLESWITQKVTEATKMEPQGLENGICCYKK